MGFGLFLPIQRILYKFTSYFKKGISAEYLVRAYINWFWGNVFFN